VNWVNIDFILLVLIEKNNLIGDSGSLGAAGKAAAPYRAIASK
jgi:hypothetical protein